MKNIKYIIVLLSVIVLSGCDNADTYTLDSFENGGFVKFVETPEFRIGTVPTEVSFDAMVEDPTGNVVMYSLSVTSTFDGAPADPVFFTSTDTFPFDVSFNMEDLAAIFNVPVSTFEENDDFFFSGTVTTDDGRVYTGEAPDYDVETGENNGGLTDSVLLTAGGLLSALDYRVRLRDPL